MLISEGNLPKDSLKGEVVIVTGAGRGIGYEAAKALVWLGANVAIAEVNEKDGKTAAENLEKELGAGHAVFVKTDIGNEKDIEKLAKEVSKKWGKVDVVLNNATVFPMGSVKDTVIEKWDVSYRVNLRGPVLLARTFLPDMIKRSHGTFVCVSSSGAAPYMGAYEVFKTAQGELASTISAEVEGTGVYAFTIGPGIVKTPGFTEGGAQVAALMGKTLDELLQMNKRFEISPEAAGVGFAAAIALASKHNGQETSSIQLLREIGVDIGAENEEKTVTAKATQQTAPPAAINNAKGVDELYESVLKTYVEQSEGWKKRNLFERQWVLRDFKKNTGMSVDEMHEALNALGENLKNKTPTAGSVETLKLLSCYYWHQQGQLRGFEKNQKKLQENLGIMDDWLQKIKALLDKLDALA
jgi:NAD(P)-dependent dehydrogenase (short-subunit alcohol dehydrogenase family)